MTTGQPVEVTRSAVRASALAAWQLVEDARYRPERRPRNERRRLLAQRTVAERRAARDADEELHRVS